MDVEWLDHYDRVLIKQLERGVHAKAWLVSGDSAREKPLEGRVIATGRKAWLDADGARCLEVAPGDRVLFGSHCGTELQIDGQRHLILREEDVLAVLR